MNSPPSPFPFELNYDQQHKLFISKPPQSPSSSSSFSNPIVLNPAQDHRGELKQLHNDQEAHNFFPHGGSCDDPITLKDESYNGLKLTIWSTKESRSETESKTSSVKWMPSKMRMMRKMIRSDRTGSEKFEDQKQPLPAPSETDNNSSTNTTVRVCSDCNTTKTPLWRSGPRGPKSLCNACGIRQRKARRAMAAAAAAANGTILAANPPSIKSKVKHSKEKRSSNGYVPKFKKKCKLTNPSSHGRDQKLCFEDFTISLSKNSAFQRVFPQDEKEAAILLMALSYGLVHG